MTSHSVYSLLLMFTHCCWLGSKKFAQAFAQFSISRVFSISLQMSFSTNQTHKEFLKALKKKVTEAPLNNDDVSGIYWGATEEEREWVLEELKAAMRFAARVHEMTKYNSGHPFGNQVCMTSKKSIELWNKTNVWRGKSIAHKIRPSLGKICKCRQRKQEEVLSHPVISAPAYCNSTCLRL